MDNHSDVAISGEIKSPIVPALPQSIIQLAEAIKSLEKYSPTAIRNLLRDADITVEDLMPWADFDHPLEDSYGRKMIYDGGFFEIMVMSWNPGDFSSIHDHGYTQWGAVKIFGPAEHAIFLVHGNTIKTISRDNVSPGDTLGVGHELVHQMGNPTSDQRFLSLHIYGNYDRESDITAEARLFNLSDQELQIVNGGVFYDLPDEVVQERREGPVPDFATRLRDQVEMIRRVQKVPEQRDKLEIYKRQFLDVHSFRDLSEDLEKIIDEHGQAQQINDWRILHWELKEAVKLRKGLFYDPKSRDYFQNYAQVYDELIGKPCMDRFMRSYLEYFKMNYAPDIENKDLMSIGCGTGLVERMMINELGVQYDNLYGVDFSTGMVDVAKKRIRAEWGDARELDPEIRLWDITYCGLNVFQYVDHRFLESVIAKTGEITASGGFFVGDFITPDHLRCYPNVMYSDNKDIISLHVPKLVEKDNHLYQESEIININSRGGELDIRHEGKHMCYLPPLHKVREYFENAFPGGVDLYDAVNLTPINKNQDTCRSTRYLVVAQK